MAKLETLSGRAEDDRGRIQRFVDSRVSALSAESVPFEADAADWVAPVPTNVGDALRRLAAAGGTHPVP